MTSEQLPQHCLLQDTLRKIAWPEDLPLMEKLYGDLAAPRSMVAFVREELVFLSDCDDQGRPII